MRDTIKDALISKLQRFTEGSKSQNPSRVLDKAVEAIMTIFQLHAGEEFLRNVAAYKKNPKDITPLMPIIETYRQIIGIKAFENMKIQVNDFVLLIGYAQGNAPLTYPSIYLAQFTNASATKGARFERSIIATIAPGNIISYSSSQPGYPSEKFINPGREVIIPL